MFSVTSIMLDRMATLSLSSFEDHMWLKALGVGVKLRRAGFVMINTMCQFG